MSDEKTYIFPDGCNGQSSTDPALYALMNNGGLGGNNSALWIIFLLALFGRNGLGGFGGNGAAGEINQDYGTSLLMQAINGNRTAISELSTNMHVDASSIQNAINAVQSGVQSVGNQVGMSGQQIINAIQAGNSTLASQIANCCCENRLAICQQANALTSRIDQLASGVQTGFAATAYETASQTNALQNVMRDNTSAIIAKLDAIEDSRKDREIAALQTQLSNEHQTAAFAAMLSPLKSEISSIKASQPATVPVPYPQLTAVPTQYVYGYNGGSIWG